MTLISKTAAGCSLISCITDIHKTALIYSKNEHAKVSSDTFVSCALGSQKADNLSYKDASRKNWLLKNNFESWREGFAKVGGYLKGVGEGITRYLPNCLLAIPALCATKHKKIANLSAAGLMVLEVVDFVKNSTKLSQRTDYLK